MSKSYNSAWRSALSAAFLLAALAPVLPARAADDDLLERAARRRKIEAQKLDGEVTQALAKARRMERTNPKSALNFIRTYKFILESDTNLAKDRRNELLGSVNRLIIRLENRASTRPAAPKSKGPRRPSKSEELQKYLKGARPDPRASSPYKTAKNITSGFGKALATAKNYRFNKERGVIEILRSTDKIGSTPTGDYTLPAYWKQLTKMRKQFTGPRLTPREAALMKTMNSVMSVNFKDSPLEYVVKYLQERTGQTIIVDRNALKEVGKDYKSPVTFQAKKITVRTILKKVVGDLGLAYILKDGVIQVVSEQTARNTYTVRSYPVAGLMPAPNPLYGPAFNRAQQQYYANQLMSVIVNTVEPSSWAVNGGRGAIWYEPITQSILIRQNAELHLPAARALGGSY